MEVFIEIFSRINNAPQSATYWNIIKIQNNKSDDNVIKDWLQSTAGINEWPHQKKHILIRYTYECSLWKSCQYLVIHIGYVHNWMFFYNYQLSYEKNMKKTIKLINILKKSRRYTGLNFYDLIKITHKFINDYLYKIIYEESDIESLEKLSIIIPESTILSEYITSKKFGQSLRYIWITACIILD